MGIKLYSIRDSVAGVYASPFLASSVGLAVRTFRNAMINNPLIAKDCSLYCLGDYNQETGDIIPNVTFVCNYTEATNE